MRILFLMMLLIPSLCLADSFEITKNGIVYLCTSEAQPDPNGASDCVSKAYAGPFNQQQALQLCQGAYSTAPADCAAKAYAGPLSLDQAVNLCIRATSTGPADCVDSAYAGPFSLTQAIELCSDDGSLATSQCAIRAYAGPYSLQQAIDLCRRSPHLVNPALIEMHQEAKIGFQEVLNKAMIKAGKRSLSSP